MITTVLNTNHASFLPVYTASISLRAGPSPCASSYLHFYSNMPYLLLQCPLCCRGLVKPLFLLLGLLLQTPHLPAESTNFLELSGFPSMILLYCQNRCTNQLLFKTKGQPSGRTSQVDVPLGRGPPSPAPPRSAARTSHSWYGSAATEPLDVRTQQADKHTTL